MTSLPLGGSLGPCNVPSEDYPTPLETTAEKLIIFGGLEFSPADGLCPELSSLTMVKPICALPSLMRARVDRQGGHWRFEK